MALTDIRSLSLEELTKLYPRATLATTKSVVRELNELLKGKRRLQARISMEILEKYNIKIFEEYTGEADSDLLALAKDLGGAVATFDLELKERLLKEDIPVIYLRAGKKLVLDDPLRLSKES